MQRQDYRTTTLSPQWDMIYCYNHISISKGASRWDASSQNSSFHDSVQVVSMAINLFITMG